MIRIFNRSFCLIVTLALGTVFATDIVSVLGFSNLSVLNQDSLKIKMVGGIVSYINPKNNTLLVKNTVSKRIIAFKKDYVILSNFKVLLIDSKESFVAENTTNNRQFYIIKEGLSSLKHKQMARKKEIPKSIGKGKLYKEEGFSRDFGKNSGEIKMSKDFRDKMVKKDLLQILNQAGVEPAIKDGEVIGFLIDLIDPGSIYEKAGFINGDIITSINEISITDAATAVKILHSVKDMDSTSATIMRDGQEISLSIEVQ
jgi:general secretion pathway protein C